MKKVYITIEIFLVLLVLVLFIFLLFVYTNSKSLENPAIIVSQVDTRELYCGISVTTPSINSQAHFPLEISGYVNGCGWESYSNYMARLIVLDENNEVISRPYLVRRAFSQVSPVSTQFSLTIPDLTKKTGKVNLLFESFGKDTKNFIVPIELVEKPQEVDIIEE